MGFGTARATGIMAGIWLASAVAFGLGFSISTGGVPPGWFFVWLTALPALGLPLSILLHAFVRRLEHLRLADRWARLAPVLLGMVLMQAIYDHWVWDEVSTSRTSSDFLTGVAFNSVLYIWLFSFQALVIELVAASDRATLNGRRAVEAMEAARAAQLEALRSQLTPHMLFNTFNNLSALVLQGRNAEAEAMLGRLSEFMRACLDGSDMVLIPVADELELLESYIDIETRPLGQPVSLSIDCPDELLDAQVPRLILQPLIENALKYAVRPSQGRARVSVRMSQVKACLSVIVEDEGAGPGARPDAAGTGRGLSIVARRLETLFDSEAKVVAGRTQDGFRVELSLPLRRVAEATPPEFAVAARSALS